MERLYDLLHRVSRATKRKGVLQADLSFLTATRRYDGRPACCARVDFAPDWSRRRSCCASTARWR